MSSLSDEFIIPITTLARVSGAMTTIHDSIDTESHSLTTSADFDDVGGTAVQQALEDFSHEWTASLEALITNISVVGELARVISETATQVDADFAKALTPVPGEDE